MVNRRPTPELARARHWEIKRRYERHAKVGRRSRIMAAIRIAELTRWLSDLVGDGTELEASKWAEDTARIFVHHFVVLADGNRRAAAWMETYCPWISTPDREYMITEANHCPIKWSADKMGWKIRLSDEQRTRLRITSIGAVGVSKEQRAIIRKQKAAERAKRHRDLKRVRTI
jgi:hypothetical protein